MPHPFDQSRYQVRFEWGEDGLTRLADADIVVVIDVLRFSTTVTDAASRGETVALEGAAHAVSRNGARIAAAAAASGALVLLGCLRNAAAVAHAVLGEQSSHLTRATVALIAAGELVSPDPGSPLRFAVEDQLGAGAIVDALGRLGIDDTSPEAAAAGESFRGLRRGARHLLTASGSGRELATRGRRDEVHHAAEIDAVEDVPVLRNGVFERL